MSWLEAAVVFEPLTYLAWLIGLSFGKDVGS